MKNIIILSNKSSGSTACQNLLSRFASINHLKHTRHGHNETLYWTKAASLLGYPQHKMVDSEVPIAKNRARKEIEQLLLSNVPGYQLPEDNQQLVYDGWHQLCRAYQPIFVEKSPHHLYQWSALELIIEAVDKLSDIEFMLIGLVRNPMDTLYSAFSRWRTLPEQAEKEWLTAYTNLLKLKQALPQCVEIVRYEDMVNSLATMAPVFSFCGVEIKPEHRQFMHNQSVNKWKKDSRFGFVLSEPVVALAKQYGYTDVQLLNETNRWWPSYRLISRASYKGYNQNIIYLRRLWHSLKGNV